jgi:very-short-patch-repair endonuclease
MSKRVASIKTVKQRIPKALSHGEEAFALHCRAEFPPRDQPVREHRFHPERKWRFDFAFLSEKLAVEIEGGVFAFGGHSRGKGFEKDCEKYNAAIKLGWRVLRYSTDQAIAGHAINDVLEVMKQMTESPLRSNPGLVRHAICEFRGTC